MINNIRSYATIYVNDIILASNNTEELIKLEKTLDLYALTKLGKIKEYLGIQIQMDKERVYYTHQRKHICPILETYGLKNAKVSNILLTISVVYDSLKNHKILQDKNL